MENRGSAYKAPFYKNFDHSPRPVLFLQGVTDNPYRRADAFTAHELMKLADPETKSARIEFEEGDYCLYNVSDRAIDEIFNWLKDINII